jgi:hypothetical protein
MSLSAWITFARLHLVGRGHRILEIEENHVDIGVGGFLDHRGVRARHGQFRTLQSLLFQRVKGVTHLGPPQAGQGICRGVSC